MRTTKDVSLTKKIFIKVFLESGYTYWEIKNILKCSFRTISEVKKELFRETTEYLYIKGKTMEEVEEINKQQSLIYKEEEEKEELTPIDFYSKIMNDEFEEKTEKWFNVWNSIIVFLIAFWSCILFLTILNF